REGLALAEALGELVRVRQEVDPRFELFGVVMTLDRCDPTPALLFERPTGYASPVCAQLLATRRRLARMLGFPEDPLAFKRRWLETLDQTIAPVLVPRGPCQGRVVREEIDLLRLFPIPWNSPDTGGPYLEPLVVSKDPETGSRNVGMYRCMIAGPDRVTLNMRREGGGGSHLYQAQALGRPFPVALVIGGPPALYVAGYTKLPYGQDEYGLAGALLGRPVELVRCLTVDLEVPASAEIVIEGTIWPPYEEVDEGPFPEYLGCLGTLLRRPYLRVSAVTCQPQPILYAITSHSRDDVVVQELINAAMHYKALTGFAPGFVQDACLTPGSGTWHHLVVKVRKEHPLHEGLQISVAQAAFSLSVHLDLVVLVDEDIDIYDMREVDWAICTRCNPARQVYLLPEGRTHRNVPIAAAREHLGDGRTVKGKWIIDATIPFEYRAGEKTPGVSFFDRTRYQPVDLRKFLEPGDLRRLGLLKEEA
ncbi:MAG: UbiD family decarboxylase, partial [Deltaproteobacteria bacterium]|nr:UbiD family decarboxylase [Deltaproteobacteria bacterium]